MTDGSTTTSDKNLRDLESRLEASLIQQEHRLTAILMNLYNSLSLPSEDPKRKAAISALIWKILSPQTAAIAGISAISLFGLLIAIQANILLSQQNDKIDQQSFLIEAQRRSVLVTEFTAILEKIDKERERAGLAGVAKPEPVILVD